jgi:hypothetical protein
MWKPWFFVSLAAKYLKHKNYKWAKGVLFVEQRIFFLKFRETFNCAKNGLKQFIKFVVIMLSYI